VAANRLHKDKKRLASEQVDPRILFWEKMYMLNSNKRISGEQLPNVFPAATKNPALRRGEVCEVFVGR